MYVSGYICLLFTIDVAIFCVILKEGGHMVVNKEVAMTSGRQNEEEVDTTKCVTSFTSSMFLFGFICLFLRVKLTRRIYLFAALKYSTIRTVCLSTMET